MSSRSCLERGNIDSYILTSLGTAQLFLIIQVSLFNYCIVPTSTFHHEVGFREGADRTAVEWSRDMLGMGFGGGEGIGQLFERV